MVVLFVWVYIAWLARFFFVDFLSCRVACVPPVFVYFCPHGGTIYIMDHLNLPSPNDLLLIDNYNNELIALLSNREDCLMTEKNALFLLLLIV